MATGASVGGSGDRQTPYSHSLVRMLRAATDGLLARLWLPDAT